MTDPQSDPMLRPASFADPSLDPDHDLESTRVHGEISSFGRILDPVRAAALHEAVAHIGVNGTEGPDVLGEVLAIAARFERYLAGEEAR